MYFCMEPLQLIFIIIFIKLVQSSKLLYRSVQLSYVILVYNIDNSEYASPQIMNTINTAILNNEIVSGFNINKKVL